MNAVYPFTHLHPDLVVYGDGVSWPQAGGFALILLGFGLLTWTEHVRGGHNGDAIVGGAGNDDGEGGSSRQ